MPLVFLGASLYSITFQSFRDVTEAASFQVLSENPSHNLGFFLINDEVAIGVLCISQEVVMINLDLCLPAFCSGLCQREGLWRNRRP